MEAHLTKKERRDGGKAGKFRGCHMSLLYSEPHSSSRPTWNWSEVLRRGLLKVEQ